MRNFKCLSKQRWQINIGTLETFVLLIFYPFLYLRILCRSDLRISYFKNQSRKITEISTFRDRKKYDIYHVFCQTIVPLWIRHCHLCMDGHLKCLPCFLNFQNIVNNVYFKIGEQFLYALILYLFSFFNIYYLNKQCCWILNEVYVFFLIRRYFDFKTISISILIQFFLYFEQKKMIIYFESFPSSLITRLKSNLIPERCVSSKNVLSNQSSPRFKKLSSELGRRLGLKVGFKELRLESKLLNRWLWSNMSTWLFSKQSDGYKHVARSYGTNLKLTMYFISNRSVRTFPIVTNLTHLTQLTSNHD